MALIEGPEGEAIRQDEANFWHFALIEAPPGDDHPHARIHCFQDRVRRKCRWYINNTCISTGLSYRVCHRVEYR